MRNILLVVLTALALTTSGCIANVTPFGNITDIQEVDLTSNFKTGETCAWFILFHMIGPFGDVSVVKAAQKSGIKKAEIVDYRIENYLIADRTCAVVYGK